MVRIVLDYHWISALSEDGNQRETIGFGHGNQIGQWHPQHFAWDHLFWGVSLCTVGYLAVTLASTHYMPVVPHLLDLS